MDDGRTTVFRWLAGGPTGLAGFTGHHYGPGRGAGHSIQACLVAHRVTGDRRYLDKAEELIRRAAHPDVPVGPEYAADVEGRWSYTAFLQALGVYLQGKVERQEIDEMYGYARACLLRFARWMREHEAPYLDRPERLEFPTQTWAAQDLRKAEVFAWAALCATGDERAALAERARFFHDYAVRTLPTLPGYWYTRPLVLALANGARFAWFEAQMARETHWPQGPPLQRWRRPERFEPQRVRAIRRAKVLVLALAAAAIVVVAAVLRWWWG
jgi:hypothetical protein